MINVDKKKGISKKHRGNRKIKSEESSKSSRRNEQGYVFAQPEKRGAEWSTKPTDNLDNDTTFKTLMERLSRAKISENTSESRVGDVLQEYTRGVVTAMSKRGSLSTTLSRVGVNSSMSHEELSRAVAPTVELFKECPIVNFKSVYYETSRDVMLNKHQQNKLTLTTQDGERRTFSDIKKAMNQINEEDRSEPIKHISLEKQIKQRVSKREEMFVKTFEGANQTVQEVWLRYVQEFSDIAIYYLQYIIEPEMRLQLVTEFDTRRKDGKRISWMSYEEQLLYRAAQKTELNLFLRLFRYSRVNKGVTGSVDEMVSHITRAAEALTRRGVRMSELTVLQIIQHKFSADEIQVLSTQRHLITSYPTTKQEWNELEKSNRGKPCGKAGLDFSQLRDEMQKIPFVTSNKKKNKKRKVDSENKQTTTREVKRSTKFSTYPKCTECGWYVNPETRIHNPRAKCSQEGKKVTVNKGIETHKTEKQKSDKNDQGYTSTIPIEQLAENFCIETFDQDMGSICNKKNDLQESNCHSEKNEVRVEQLVENNCIEVTHEVCATTKRRRLPRSEITRAKINIAIMNADKDHKHQEVVACLDSASSISIAPLRLLHNVTTMDTSTVAKHMTGSTKYTQQGWLVVPQQVGNTLVQCYVGKEEQMPTHTKILLGKPALSLLHVDMNSHIDTSGGDKIITIKVRDELKDFKPTHQVTNNKTGNVYACKVIEDERQVILSKILTVQLKSGIITNVNQEAITRLGK